MQNILISRKLPAAFALLAVLASVIIGIVAYYKSSESLDEAFEAKLAGLAASRGAALKNYLRSLREDLRTQAENPRMLEAFEALQAGWVALGGNQESILQKAYITDNPNKAGEKHKLDAAPAANAYNLAHAKYHPWIRKFLEERGYYDIFLFAPNGDLVYTVFKELDYATNLLNGKWKDTDLGNAFKSAIAGKAGEEHFFDFKAYAPSNGAPAAFLSMPLHDAAGKITGVLAFQMPIDRINKVMQVSEGMGKTGETYIVGADLLMRSDSRFSKESTILKTKIDTAAARAGISGKKGVMIGKDYRGEEVMSAFYPTEFLGSKFVVLAEIDFAEIEAPVFALRNFMLIILAFVIAGSIAAGIFMARTITSPIGKIREAIDRVAEGEFSAEIPGTGRGDEIGTMAKSLTRIRDDAAKAGELMVMIDTMPFNVMTCDPSTFNINYANTTSIETLRQLEDLLPISADEVVGASVDKFCNELASQHGMLGDPARLPYATKFQVGHEHLDLKITAVTDKAGHYIGPMLSWQIITRQAEMANNFEKSVGRVVDSVSTAAAEMKTQARAMATSADQTNELATSVAAAAEQATVNVQAVSAAAEELTSSISEISRQVSASAEITQRATQQADRTDEQIQGLAEAANRIGEVVNLITDIAEQTNLLALNATIEAARAGDAGKGFAVVASEVKNLASQTAKATDEIGTQISGIQGATQDAVRAIREISAVISEINQTSSTVAAAVEEQGAATQEIARNVEQAAQGTSTVAESIASVSQAAASSGESAQQILGATENLGEQSAELNTQVEQFLKEIRQG